MSANAVSGKILETTGHQKWHMAINDHTVSTALQVTNNHLQPNQCVTSDIQPPTSSSSSSSSSSSLKTSSNAGMFSQSSSFINIFTCTWLYTLWTSTGRWLQQPRSSERQVVSLPHQTTWTYVKWDCSEAMNSTNNYGEFGLVLAVFTVTPSGCQQ